MNGSATGAPAPRATTAARVGVINLVSRVTGFARVLATAAALGIAALGDTYQSANAVSNVLFELLAGGLLFAVLVPAFVAGATEGADAAAALAAVVLARVTAGLALVAAVGLALSPVIAELLLGRAPVATRDQQVELATVLLWFVLPQLVLYGVGAVVTASLQAARRFDAAAAAPIANNVVVVATMLVFAAVHDAERGLDLTVGETVLLGGGTLGATVAMVAVVVLDAVRSGELVRPRWSAPGVDGLARLARQGAWGAGHVGLNQVLLLATLVIANRVSGGSAAFTFAFALFLLPYALVAHPIATTLTPDLAEHAARGDDAAAAADLGRGLRPLVVLLAVASALGAALVGPALAVLDGIGALDRRGVELVASTTGALLVGLVGYGATLLLTRAAYARGEVRGPTLVNAGVVLVAVVAMIVVSGRVTGDARVWGLGLVHAVSVSAGCVALAVLVVRGRPSPRVRGALGRAVAAATAAGVVALGATRVLGWATPGEAVVATAAGLVLGGGAALGVLAVLGAPELHALGARRGPRATRGGDGSPPAAVGDDRGMGRGEDS